MTTMTKKKTDDKTGLDAVLKDISKNLHLQVSRLKNQDVEPLARIPTGCLSLDLATGGGWAQGRIHEVYGPEGTGKTMLTLFAIAQAQKLGLNAAFIDMEHALDPEWAQKLGVNTDDMVFTQPDSGEQALNTVLQLAESGKFGLIVVDSVAALVPQSELDGDIGDQSMGVQARMMGQALRKIAPAAAKSGTVVIFINQLRMKLGVMFGNPETTPGGNALKFYASLRLEVRRVSKSEIIDENKYQIGHDQRVKVVKNKISPPFREAVVPINYVQGVRVVDDAVRVAQIVGAMSSSGVFSIDTKAGKVESSNVTEFTTLLTQDAAVRDAVVDAIRGLALQTLAAKS